MITEIIDSERLYSNEKYILVYRECPATSLFLSINVGKKLSSTLHNILTYGIQHEICVQCYWLHHSDVLSLNRVATSQLPGQRWWKWGKENIALSACKPLRLSDVATWALSATCLLALISHLVRCTRTHAHTHVIKIHILNACWHMNSYHWLFKCKAKYMQLSHAPFTWAILKWQWVCSQNMSGPKKKNTGKTGQKCSWPSKHTGTNTSHTNAHIVQTHWNNTHRSFLWSIYHSLNKVTTHVQEVDATFGKTYISGWQQSHITIYTACYTCSIAGENINEIAHKKTKKKGGPLCRVLFFQTLCNVQMGTPRHAHIHRSPITTTTLISWPTSLDIMIYYCLVSGLC